MTTINKLTRTDTVSAGDVVPVYVQNQGDARGAAMSVILAYIQAGLEISGSDFIMQYAIPTLNGFSVQVTDNAQNTHLILAPTGTFATGTIILPNVANLISGQQIMVTATQSVGTLTINPNGASVIGQPTTLGINDTFILKYDEGSALWYTIGHSVPNPATTDTVQTLTNKTLTSPVINTGTLNTPTISIPTVSSGTFTNPTLVTPALGTPASGNLTNCTGYDLADLVGAAAGILAFLASPTSANLLAALTNETGTGLAVFNTSPTLVTPNIGAAVADSLQRGAPVLKTVNFTVAANENWITCFGSATITITLPSASSSIGREIMIRNTQPFTVVSAASNVVPRAAGPASTAILPATAGAWCTLVSDGTNWISMNGS